MSSSAPDVDARAKQVHCTDEELKVELVDGRSISVPLSWFPRLMRATPGERANFELLGDGHGIHWPDVDEDVSVDGLLRGARSPEA